jgi:hypothetical protein
MQKCNGRTSPEVSPKQNNWFKCSKDEVAVCQKDKNACEHPHFPREATGLIRMDQS